MSIAIAKKIFCLDSTIINGFTIGSKWQYREEIIYTICSWKEYANSQGMPRQIDRDIMVPLKDNGWKGLVYADVFRNYAQQIVS